MPAGTLAHRRRNTARALSEPPGNTTSTNATAAAIHAPGRFSAKKTTETGTANRATYTRTVSLFSQTYPPPS